MRLNEYLKFKKESEDRVKNQKGLFFAFSNEQFQKGLESVGASEQNKVVSLGAGGYILKSEFDDFNIFFEKRQEQLEKNLKDDNDFARQAFEYELCNHEYCITQDDTDALDALGIDYKFIIDNKLSKEWVKAVAVAIEAGC